MELCFSNIAWDSENELEIALFLKGAGITNIEVAPGKLFNSIVDVTDREVLGAKTKWKKLGFDILSMQGLLFNRNDLQVFASSEAQKNLFNYLVRLMKIASSLGVLNLVFGSPMNRCYPTGMPYKKVLSDAVVFFRKIGDAAKSEGVYFCVEPVSEVHGGNFIQNTEEAIELVKLIDHSNIRINLDTSTLLMNGENIEQSILIATPFIQHFHISAPNLSPVSDQVIPFELIKSMLSKINYKKSISVEMRARESIYQVDDVKRATNDMMKYFDIIQN